VWSLGVVLYELLSGRLPYDDASSLGELMVSIITADIPLLQDKAPWVPPELAEVAHRAMSRDVTKRFQHAGELRDALAALVTDGPRITPDMMLSVPAEQRAMVAPRLELADDGMLRATTRTGLVTTHGAAVRAKKSSAPLVVAVLVGLTVVGGGGIAAFMTLKKQALADAQAQAEAQAQRQPPSAPSPTVMEARPPAAAVIRTFPLTVGPAKVEVFVDGAKQDVTDGKIQLSGAPGATRKVKLKLDQAEQEHLVAITDTGLVPDRLSVEAPKAAPAAPRGGARPARKPGVAPEQAPPPAKPADKPAPKIDKSLSEFG
jgi:serine/threonine-protein kinase